MDKFLAQTQIELIRLMITSAVVQNLNIQTENSMLNTDLCIDQVLAAIKKYKHHQSIIFINIKMSEKSNPKLSFHFAT